MILTRVYAAWEICYNGRMDKIVRSLFWDADINDLDPARHAPYVIERVLEHGDEVQVRWLFGQYSPEAIRRVVETTRRLSPRSLNYWLVKFKLWKAEQSIPRHSAIWKY